MLRKYESHPCSNDAFTPNSARASVLPLPLAAETNFAPFGFPIFFSVMLKDLSHLIFLVFRSIRTFKSYTRKPLSRFPPFYFDFVIAIDRVQNPSYLPDCFSKLITGGWVCTSRVSIAKSP